MQQNATKSAAVVAAVVAVALRLREKVFHHFAMDICEAGIPARVSIGKVFVIETEQVQNRGVQVVDMNGILDGP